jgi:hypothetical protein
MCESRQFWTRMVGYIAVGLLSMGWMLPAGRALSPAQPQALSPAQPQTATRQLGTVQSIAASTVTLTTDAAQSVVVHVANDTKIVKLPAGSKDMKDAQAIELMDIAVGDRILVRGKPGDEASSFLASTIIVMKGDEIQQKRQQEQQDWQKRGTGGLVKSVDPAVKSITISAAGRGTTKITVIKTSSATVVRRYAPDSVKFEDAQPGTLAQIQPGDQLRARGPRNAEGDLEAEEIVSGSFSNVAGTVVKMNAASGVLDVKDAATQKPVTLKISADSQLRRLPPQAAQMMASRASGAPPSASATPSAHPGGTPPAGMQPPGGMNGSSPGRGAPDLQQMMARLPKMPPDELHPGDAVMIVATPGAANGEGTVITLLAGVEAILAATPKGAQVMTLSPWNINGSPADSAGTP